MATPVTSLIQNETPASLTLRQLAGSSSGERSCLRVSRLFSDLRFARAAASLSDAGVQEREGEKETMSAESSRVPNNITRCVALG